MTDASIVSIGSTMTPVVSLIIMAGVAIGGLVMAGYYNAIGQRKNAVRAFGFVSLVCLAIALPTLFFSFV